jgi:hypothetical protein
MKTILLTVAVAIIASASALGWVMEKPIDHAEQLKKSDFSGIVEVTSIVATGQKKLLADYRLMPGHNVQFRELRLDLKVLSAFKGRSETLTCSIYRAPTEEELIADGVTKEDIMKILLNLSTDEWLHLFPAHVTKGAHILVYLKADGVEHIPVTGDLKSSRSLLIIKPSNLVNTMDRNGNAEQAGTGQPATRPESNSEGSSKPQPEAEGRSR